MSYYLAIVRQECDLAERCEMARTLSPTVVPTFTLFHVDPHTIVADYMAGKYATVTIPRMRVAVDTTTLGPLVKTTYSTSRAAESFSLSDRSGGELVFINSNHGNCELIRTQGVISGRVCEWCRLLTTTPMEGIPHHVSVELSNLRDTSDPEKIMIFHTRGATCNFRCMLAAAQSTEVATSFHNILERNTIHYVHMMYHLMYPRGPPLTAAPDFRLLREHGGSLSRDEFEDPAYKFVPTYAYITAPTKHCYQRVES